MEGTRGRREGDEGRGGLGSRGSGSPPIMGACEGRG